MRPVLIVGGGPVGLTAALCLAVARVPVILFEADAEISTDLRASTFHPPTLDMLDGFGLGRELVRRGRITPSWQVRLHESGERAQFDLSVLQNETRHPYRLQCEQQILQQLLVECLAGYPHASIRFGCRVDAVGQDDAGVWVEARGERLAGSWLIGADGARSVVRRGGEIGFSGETYPETTILVTTDFDFAAALEGLSGVNYVWSRTGTFSLLHLPGLWRCSFYPAAGQSPEDALAEEAIEQQLQGVVARPERYRVLHKRCYRIHQRVAQAYRRGRMLLAGDAAHLNSPSGGMGMNGGIHDAFNLTEKLVRVLGGADERLMDLYERQRRPIALEHILAQADRNRRRMRETDSERRRAMLQDLQRTAADPRLAHAYLLNSSMITGLRQAAAVTAAVELREWVQTMTGATMEARSVRYAWYVAGLLTLAQVISYLDRFLPSLLVQPIKHDLGLNDFQVGLLLGPAFTLFYIILGIPLGWLADRVSRRALLAVGIAIWCTMTAAAAGARGFVSLLVTRLGVGVGEATVAPTSISLLSDYFSPERRSRAISLFMSGTFLGAGTAFLFFGPLVHHIESLPLVSLPIVGPLQSWRLCFLIVGAPGLLLTVLMLTIREPSRRDWNGTGVGVLGRRPTFGDGVAFILKHWRAFGTLFVGSACNVTMGALALWNVGLFKRTWNWNVAQVGVAVGLILFTAGPLGTLLGVFLTNRDTKAGRPDGTLRALFVGLVIGVPAYVLFPLMPSAGLGLAWLFCAHVGQAMATAAGPATLVVLAPGAIRAQTTAIYYLVISALAQLIGPPLVGLIADGIGSPDALRYAVSIEAGGVGIVAIWLVLLGFRHYRRSVAELREVSAELPPQAAPAIQAVSERA